MRSKNLLLIWIAIASCSQPADFVADNPNDPLAENFSFNPATGFQAQAQFDGSIKFRWSGGTSNLATVQIIRVSASDTLWIHNAVNPTQEWTYRPVTYPPGGFRFELRMVLNDQSSAWMTSPSMTYLLSNSFASAPRGTMEGISISWTRTTNSTFAINYGGSVYITTPLDSVVLFKSINGLAFKRLQVFSGQSNYIDNELPDVAQPVRYQLQSWYKGSFSLSTPTQPLRRDYAANHSLLMDFGTRMAFQDIDSERNLALMIAYDDYKVHVVDLTLMRFIKSIPISTLRPTCSNCQQMPTASFGASGDIYVGFGDQIISWNRSTDAVSVIQTLSPSFNAFQIEMDSRTGLLAVLSSRSSTTLEFELDIIDPVSKTRTTSMRFDAPNAPQLALSPYESSILLWTTNDNDFRIVPLDNPASWTTLSLDQHPGPIFRMPGESISSIFYPHPTNGLNQIRFDGTVQRILDHLGKISEVAVSNTKKELYLNLGGGHILILDVSETGFREKRQIHYFTIDTYQNLVDWNQRILVIPDGSTSMWELEEYLLWFLGPIPQYPN